MAIMTIDRSDDLLLQLDQMQIGARIAGTSLAIAVHSGLPLPLRLSAQCPDR
jgi:hypothetical protein